MRSVFLPSSEQLNDPCLLPLFVIAIIGIKTTILLSGIALILRRYLTKKNSKGVTGLAKEYCVETVFGVTYWFGSAREFVARRTNDPELIEAILKPKEERSSQQKTLLEKTAKNLYWKQAAKTFKEQFGKKPAFEEIDFVEFYSASKETPKATRKYQIVIDYRLEENIDPEKPQSCLISIKCHQDGTSYYYEKKHDAKYGKALEAFKKNGANKNQVQDANKILGLVADYFKKKIGLPKREKIGKGNATIIIPHKDSV